MICQQILQCIKTKNTMYKMFVCVYEYDSKINRYIEVFVL